MRTSPSPHLRAPTGANSERTTTESANHLPTADMISTITKSETITSLETIASRKPADVAQQEIDTFDARSSSLSDLDDATEDRTVDTVSKASAKANEDEFDSEAETERLEKTPRKANAAHYNNPGAQNGVEKTPSKLAHEVVLDGMDERSTRTTGSPISLIPSPITPVQETADMDIPARDQQESESPSRKRKRSASATSSLSEADIPLAKRANSAKYNLEALAPSTETLDLQLEYSNGMTEDITLPDALAVNGADHADEELDAVPIEPTVPLKGKKGGKKGKRKGKKANGGNDSEAVGEPSEPMADFEPELAEAEVEDEEDSSRDEERTLYYVLARSAVANNCIGVRKQHAFDALRKIEKEFVAFREK